jgi:hypothetical protein
MQFFRTSNCIVNFFYIHKALYRDCSGYSDAESIAIFSRSGWQVLNNIFKMLSYQPHPIKKRWITSIGVSRASKNYKLLKNVAPCRPKHSRRYTSPNVTGRIVVINKNENLCSPSANRNILVGCVRPRDYFLANLLHTLIGSRRTGIVS